MELEAPKPIPWYPDKLGWQFTYSRFQLRKVKALEEVHELLKRENEAGSITRQEAVSMVPPLFLDVQPHHRVCVWRPFTHHQTNMMTQQPGLGPEMPDMTDSPGARSLRDCSQARRGRTRVRVALEPSVSGKYSQPLTLCRCWIRARHQEARRRRCWRCCTRGRPCPADVWWPMTRRCSAAICWCTRPSACVALRSSSPTMTPRASPASRPAARPTYASNFGHLTPQADSGCQRMSSTRFCTGRIMSWCFSC